MGAFHFVRDILNHNKSAETKNKEALEKGMEEKSIEFVKKGAEVYQKI